MVENSLNLALDKNLEIQEVEQTLNITHINLGQEKSWSNSWKLKIEEKL